MLRAPSSWLAVPHAGILVSAVSAFLLMIPDRRSGTTSGTCFPVSILCLLGALNMRASVLQPGQVRSVLVVFMTGSAAAMAVVVLGAAWRHGNMDGIDAPARQASFYGSPGPVTLKLWYRPLIDIDHFKRNWVSPLL
jgi:formate-dependent nitrite reductase membrane component NrfD